MEQFLMPYSLAGSDVPRQPAAGRAQPETEPRGREVLFGDSSAPAESQQPFSALRPEEQPGLHH